MNDLTLVLLIGATALSGILAGASLDQSIKQLPARQRMGMAAYAAYARAADLGNGIAWYAGLGIGAALLTIAAAALGFVFGVRETQELPLYAAAGLAVLHTISTTQAAPVMLSIRNAADDEAEMGRTFYHFEAWQTIRAILQVLAFAMLLWVLVAGQGPAPFRR